MSKAILVAGAVALSLGAAPAQATNFDHVLKGAGIGGAVGLIVGAIVPGLPILAGGAIGIVGGAAVGAATSSHHHHYRDDTGKRYWTDQDGTRHYDDGTSSTPAMAAPAMAAPATATP